MKLNIVYDGNTITCYKDDQVLPGLQIAVGPGKKYYGAWYSTEDSVFQSITWNTPAKSS
jgi:hypothetical protein